MYKCCLKNHTLKKNLELCIIIIIIITTKKSVNKYILPFQKRLRSDMQFHDFVGVKVNHINANGTTRNHHQKCPENLRFQSAWPASIQGQLYQLYTLHFVIPS